MSKHVLQGQGTLGNFSKNKSPGRCPFPPVPPSLDKQTPGVQHSPLSLLTACVQRPCSSADLSPPIHQDFTGVLLGTCCSPPTAGWLAHLAPPLSLQIYPFQYALGRSPPKACQSLAVCKQPRQETGRLLAVCKQP